MTNFFFQAFLVNGTYLFKENNGILDKPVLFSIQFHMGRQLGLGVRDVMAAQMTVGLWRLPVSF